MTREFGLADLTHFARHESRSRTVTPRGAGLTTCCQLRLSYHAQVVEATAEALSHLGVGALRHITGRMAEVRSKP